MQNKTLAKMAAAKLRLMPFLQADAANKLPKQGSTFISITVPFNLEPIEDEQQFCLQASAQCLRISIHGQYTTPHSKTPQASLALVL